jgi:hypothetical protein
MIILLKSGQRTPIGIATNKICFRKNDCNKWVLMHIVIGRIFGDEVVVPYKLLKILY